MDWLCEFSVLCGSTSYVVPGFSRTYGTTRNPINVRVDPFVISMR